MVAGEVIADSPSQPDLKALAQVDMHRLLRDPDGLSVLVRELDYAKAAQVVDYLAFQLCSATEIDAIGIIDQMALLTADDDDRPVQSVMRNLSHAVAAFVANCMQFVADDDVEIVLVDFVSIASLAAGCELLRKVGQEHRSTCLRPRGDVDSNVRYAADAKAVEPAVEVWRHRANRAIASGNVMDEDLGLFLAGLAR